VTTRALGLNALKQQSTLMIRQHTDQYVLQPEQCQGCQESDWSAYVHSRRDSLLGQSVAWTFWKAHKGQSAASRRDLPHRYFPPNMHANTAYHRGVAQLIGTRAPVCVPPSAGRKQVERAPEVRSLRTELLFPSRKTKLDGIPKRVRAGHRTRFSQTNHVSNSLRKVT